MSDAAALIREFVHQIDKTLNSRRLYAPGSIPYREAGDKLLEKCRAASLEDSFTLRFGTTDIFLEKISMINRTKHEESFFFPLYRDGLREMTFTPDVSAEDLEALLGVFEAREKRTAGYDDSVNLLWRCDLTTIRHNAIDGIGDTEGEDDPLAAKDDFRSLISDLTSKISQPAAPMQGQTYAFVMDADVRVASQDFHYDRSTVHRKFEENPAVLRLTEEQAAQLRSEVSGDREDILLERFCDILLIMLVDPARGGLSANLISVLQRLVEGYWSARDFPRLNRLLLRLRSVSESAPHEENRAAARDLIQGFVTIDRVRETFDPVRQGVLPLRDAVRVWSFLGDMLWDVLVEFWTRLPEGDLRSAVTTLMRNLLTANPDVLRRTLQSEDLVLLRAGLVLLDERKDRYYASDLVTLSTHSDESIRLRILSIAAKSGGQEALDILSKAMESDPAKPVRLLAFRLISTGNFPGISERLKAMVTDARFAARPVWEREKYVRLLGATAGESVIPLFESWLPTRRWFWQPKDAEIAELALRGVAACGVVGYDKVAVMADGGGKLGDIARKVIDSVARGEIGDSTVMRPVTADVAAAIKSRPGGES